MISFLKPKAQPQKILFKTEAPAGEVYQTIVFVNSKGELVGISTVGTNFETTSTVNKTIEKLFTRPVRKVMEAVQMELSNMFQVQTSEVTVKDMHL